MDKLVSDDQSDAHDNLSQFGTPRAPSVPPGLGFAAHGHPLRTSTPSRLPPGLISQPPPLNPAAVPIAVAMTPLKPALAPVPAESSKSNKKTPLPSAGSDAKKNIKALALESGLSKEITSQSKLSVKGKKAVLQDEDFPALEAAKPVSQTSTPVPAKAPSIKTPMVIKRAQTDTPRATIIPAAPEAPVDSPSTQKSKRAEKKPMPVLNIAAATKAVAAAKKSNPSSAVTSAVEKPDDAAFPALPTPSSVSISSPATRGPKTLRVISTPKTETPPSISAFTGGPPSLRQTFSELQRPETPVSENVSDSASMVSASFSASRTNSPPPSSRVGTATVRATTKSQQRKARKEATKKETAAIAATPKPEPEVEIAPILGRKKKQKKDKPASSKEATPAVESRPPSPGPVDRAAEKDSKLPVGTSTYRQAVVNESITLLDESPGLRSRRKDGTTSAAAEASRPALDRTVPSPAAVFHDIFKSGHISDLEAVALLKGISNTSHRSDQYVPVIPKNGLTELKALVTTEDQQNLLAGKPVRKIVDGSRVLLTPNGNCVRNLTPTEEERYLRLQADLATKSDDPTAYVHPRHEAGNGFSVIRGRAVANGVPPYFPQGPVTTTSSNGQPALPVVDDPMQKMSREEALANINQSILTRFNLGTMNLSSLVEGQHANDFHSDVTVSGASSTQVDAASKNVIKTLEPFFTNLAAATSHTHSSLDIAAGNESFSGLAQTMPPPPLSTTPASAFAAGKTMAANVAKGGALAGITSMTLEEMDAAWGLAKKEADKVEKSLNQVIRKNRRLLSLSSSGAGGGH